MAKFISSLILICLLSNISYADCNWALIKPSYDGNNYTYSKDLHICVGNLVNENNSLKQQTEDLNKAIELKNLAIQTSDQRADQWNKTAADLESRLQKVDSIEKKNEWLMFGLGIATTFLAAYAAAKLINR